MMAVQVVIYQTKWMEGHLEGRHRGPDSGQLKGEWRKWRRIRIGMDWRFGMNVGEMDRTGSSDLIIHLPSPGKKGGV
jgi:hypothetical protein